MSTFADAIEEETLPRYDPQHFYPVWVGQTFEKRYKVLAKLGFGAQSTIWLAQDVQRFVDKSCVASSFLLTTP
jgi:serine/threonine-protein kinase SRPK3